jgi:HEAT repeat protein
MSRPLPHNPFAGTPVEEWLTALFSAGHLDNRYRAWSAVTTLLSPTEAFPHGLRLLGDPEAELRAAAGHWLAKIVERLAIDRTDDRAAELREPLTRLLDDTDPDVRLAAAEAAVAWRLVTPDVSRTVLSLLCDPATEATSLAALARLMGRMPDAAAEAVPRLAELLPRDSAEVREAAAMALAALGDHSGPAASALVTALDDEEPLVREFAARALGQHAAVDDAMRHALQAATSDEDVVVAAAAQEALSRLGGLP